MIKIFNPNRLTRQPFFQELANYLYTHDDVTLRQIKKAFDNYQAIDKNIENYVQAGYILRQHKRYFLDISFFKIAEQVQLDEMVFVDTDSPVYQELLKLRFKTSLTNQTNAVKIVENTAFNRDQLTLSNYFYKLQNRQSLSPEQEPLYELLGDVNQEYTLKYMTTFLLKFVRKNQVLQKRTDIFVQALALLDYIRLNKDGKYELHMNLDKENLIFSACNPRLME